MPNSRTNRVKLVDIAQASGVSLTAVSLALSEKPGISQETRQRVQDVARKLGYRFKSPVSSGSAKSIKTIGLLVKSMGGDEPHANHFYSHIISGIEQTCRLLGLNLMFASLPVDEDNNPTDVPLVLEKSDVDGILLAGVFVNSVLGRILAARSCPVVLIDSYSDCCAYHAVLSDNFNGAYQATEYLVKRGHREIGFIGGHEDGYPSFCDRRAGYRRALADNGINRQYLMDATHSRSEISAATAALVQQNPQVTAMVGVNDETAISAMYALIEMGLRVPQDVSVVGFDDIYLAESVVPSLTTMRVNKQSMGRLAVQLLLNQLYQSEGGEVTAVFRPTLVERASVASPIGNDSLLAAGFQKQENHQHGQD